MRDWKAIASFVRQLYATEDDFIALHEPGFVGNEKAYLEQCIDSGFVSSVGKFVDRFEDAVGEYCDCRGVAVVNGTAALHAALHVVGVEGGDEVITQGLSFVATPNSIKMAGGNPVFLDCDMDTMGLSPIALDAYLGTHAILKSDGSYNRKTGQRIAACVPVHIFGHACRIEEICEICDQWKIPVVEDAAEAIGSTYNGKALGTFGAMGVLSFNGNKIITTGGGGMILSQDTALADKAKHLTTTAKSVHAWEFSHDAMAWNYRMPNVNAALGLAQFEQLGDILADKREISKAYLEFFGARDERFVVAMEGCESNYWLNAIEVADREVRDSMLQYLNDNKVMARPLWVPMPDLPMYRDCYCDTFENGRYLADRIVNLPSGARFSKSD